MAEITIYHAETGATKTTHSRAFDRKYAPNGWSIVGAEAEEAEESASPPSSAGLGASDGDEHTQTEDTSEED